jgi:fucose permease
MSDTKARVGASNVGNTVGMQMSAAMLGGATMPGIAGLMARYIGIEAIPVFLMVLFAAMMGLYATFIKTKLLITND